MMARNLLKFLSTPKNAGQIIAEFGYGQVAVMRGLSDRGDVILCAPHWTKTGERWLYWAKPEIETPYLRRRLSVLGADLERGGIL